MGERTKIQWCDRTFNPWIGCTKVSPGCSSCYASVETFVRVQRANGRELWGKGKPRHRTSEANWRKPLQWNRAPLICPDSHIPVRGAPGGHGPYSTDGNGRMCPECGIALRRPRVFCASMSDWLDDEVPIEWLADLLKLIHDTPNLDWQLLTKRPENWEGRIKAAWDYMYQDKRYNGPFIQWMLDWAWNRKSPSNVWFGVSVEDQKRADERIPELLKIPARVRFLSVEPMLGPIKLSAVSQHVLKHIHWAIFGGESVGGRPCNIEWILDGVNQCQDAGVKVFVKQLGSKPVDGSRMSLDADRMPLRLKDPKGGDITEWPAELRVREFPTVETP